MSASDLFGDALWRGVGESLREVGPKAAREWWDDHRDDLVGVTLAEMQDIAKSLRAGDRFAAKMAIVAQMSPAEWRAYRDGTTSKLERVAERRARLLDALEDLGIRAAKTIGTAILGALL